MPDDDSTSMIGSIQELVMGAVVLMLGYCGWRAINSPVGKALGKAVNGTANLLQWSLSSPWAFLLTVILGFVLFVAGKVGIAQVGHLEETIRTKGFDAAMGRSARGERRGERRSNTSEEAKDKDGQRSKQTTTETGTDPIDPIADGEAKPKRLNWFDGTTESAQDAARALAEADPQLKGVDYFEAYNQYTRMLAHKDPSKYGTYELTQAEVKSLAADMEKTGGMTPKQTDVLKKLSNLDDATLKRLGKFSKVMDRNVLESMNAMRINAIGDPPEKLTPENLYKSVLETNREQGELMMRKAITVAKYDKGALDSADGLKEILEPLASKGTVDVTMGRLKKSVDMTSGVQSTESAAAEAQKSSETIERTGRGGEEFKKGGEGEEAAEEGEARLA